MQASGTWTGLLMMLAWLILNPFRFLACVALMILMVLTSFMSFKLTGNRIDLGFPDPIGVTRINCLIFRFPLHVILRTFIVLFSRGVTWICCCFVALSGKRIYSWWNFTATVTRIFVAFVRKILSISLWLIISIDLSKPRQIIMPASVSILAQTLNICSNLPVSRPANSWLLISRKRKLQGARERFVTLGGQ